MKSRADQVTPRPENLGECLRLENLAEGADQTRLEGLVLP